MNLRKILLLCILASSPLAAEVEFLFSPVFTISICGPEPRFIIREADKKKINPKFWHLSDEKDFIALLEWMQKEKKEEPIQVKMMAQELYDEEDRVLMRKISEELRKRTEPNQRLQTMRFKLPMNAKPQGPHV